MTAKLIDGKKIAEFFRADYALRVGRLIEYGIRPGLAVVVVGEDAASQVYVRNKVRACEAAGVASTLIPMPSHTTEHELLAVIERLNLDASIHGILVQMPLPDSIDTRVALEAIAAEKDVDGFHYANMGALMIDESPFPPCTPYGVMKMLEYEEIKLDGKHVVIIGRSNIVGKPMAMLMLAAGATVTICHSRTQDLAKFTRDADVLVVAVGRAKMVTGTMLKPGAIVIDVGINRGTDGKLAGDVDFESAKLVAAAITPVPGGVGPMTIAMLLGNTLRAAERAAKIGTKSGETAFA